MPSEVIIKTITGIYQWLSFNKLSHAKSNPIFFLQVKLEENIEN